MWARLDDALIDHRKVWIAGEAIGKNGAGLAVGFFAIALMWTSKHLTDGFLPRAVVNGFRHVDDPMRIADALTQAGLFDQVDGGFRIHDFHDYNPSATKVLAKRKADRARKQ